MLATHYDTKLMQKFVGADDAGSVHGVMLETGAAALPQARPLSSVDHVF